MDWSFQQVQQKLKQEVKKVLGQGTNVTPEDYKNLTYVTNVMQVRTTKVVMCLSAPLFVYLFFKSLGGPGIYHSALHVHRNRFASMAPCRTCCVPPLGQS
jgi:hypothetical protein